MKKKFYITSTLPYVNSDPHIGFALEIIQADVIARYKASQGYDIFFNTGTDEHGLKIYRRALEEDLNPQKFCDKQATRFEQLKETLNLSYNNFIRTTDQDHMKAAQEFWRRCEANGDIYRKAYKAKYCVGCELFKTDSDLEGGKCPFHPTQELEIIEEENYFFRFSRYQDNLLRFYKDNPDFVIPSERYNEIVSFVECGLKDFSISRLKEKLPWGVPVPGNEEQVMAVWFDALTNYITALGWPEDKAKFKAFWPGMQVAGKDNLRQQTAMWQAMLMSAGLPNSTQVLIHGFITSDGQKMSKSLGNVIDPFELVEKYGTDAVRYFLLREIPSTEDGDFTYEKFEHRYNSDLARGLGNLVARVVTMAQERIFNSQFSIFNQFSNSNFQTFTDKTWQEYKKALDEFKFNEGLKAIWDLIGFCDRYIEKEKPWETLKPEQTRFKAGKNEKVIYNLLFVLTNIAEMLQPFLPQTSEKIFEQLKTKKSKILFPRI